MEDMKRAATLPRISRKQTASRTQTGIKVNGGIYIFEEVVVEEGGEGLRTTSSYKRGRGCLLVAVIGC